MTLFAAVGKPLKKGYHYMLAEGSGLPEMKRFLIELAGQLTEQHRRERPYLCMDGLSSHKSPKLAEQLVRFKAMYQPAQSLPANCQSCHLVEVKKEYFYRLHKRDLGFRDEAELRQFVQQVCDEVPIDPDAVLRANRSWLKRYLALGADAISGL